MNLLSSSPASQSLRPGLGLVLACLVLLVGCGALSVVALEGIEREREASAQLEASEIRALSDELFAQRAAGLYAVRAYFESSERIDASEYQAFARRILATMPGLRSLNYISTDMTLRWIVPSTERSKLQGFNLLGQRGEPVARRARASGQVAVSEPFRLHEGPQGFLMMLPLYKDGRFLGWVQGVSDTASVVSLLKLAPRSAAYAVELTDARGQVLFTNGALGRQAPETELRLGDQAWTLRLSPRPAPRDYWPLVLIWSLGLGLCGLVLNGARASVRLAREVAARTEALETSREQLAVILGAVADGVIAFSGEPAPGRVVYANAAAAELLGFASAEAMADLDSPEIVARLNFADDAGRGLEPADMPSTRALQGEGPEERVLSFTRLADGERRQMLVKARPVFDANGRVRFAISVQKDLTERLRLEAQLRQQLEDLKALDRLQNDFLSVVTHELRTPLTSIKGFSEFLEDGLGGPLTELQREYVGIIQSGASQLEHLVDDLLDLARIEAGKFTLKFQATEWGALVQQAVEAVRPAASEKGVTLSYAPPEGPVPLSGDPFRLTQVLNNLLSNAIKFTPEGGAVRVGLQAVAEEAVLVVEDTGIGIAAEHLPQLFSKFYQVERSLTRGYKGTGLGLAITKALVEAHHGRITVESEEGRGSRFVVVLPLGAPEAEEGDLTS